MSASIPFTQFLRPDGRTRAVLIDRPDAIALKAGELIARGYRFEVEELMDGTVSMTVEHADCEDGPFAIELCPNGPAVPETVDRLIADAYAKARADGR